MLRSVSASVMCLGLATLGMAVSRGEDPPKPDTEQVEVLTEVVNLVVDESAPATPAAPATAATPPAETGKAGFTAKRGELVEIQIGSDDGLVGNDEKEGVRVRFGGEVGGVVILNEEGKITEQPRPGSPIRASRTVQYYARQAQFPDPESREALEKVLAGLREDAKRLEREGKKEEAAQKTKAIQALEQLLKSQPMALGAGRVAYYAENSENAEELKKLEDQRNQLMQKLKAVAANTEDAANIHQKLKALENEIAQKHRQLAVPAGGGAVYGVQVMPVPPGVPGMGGGMAGMMRGTAGPGMMPGGMAPRWAAMPGGVRSKSAALAHQAEVLSQSAARLKEAGLEDQSKQLAEQAEKLKDQAATQAKREAEQLQAQAHAAGGFGGGISFTAGPPVELHRSIKELQEQVQMLRKEIAELRDLLQTKR